MRVWVDQDLCTGDGLCEEIAPGVFRLLDDGLCYVVEMGEVLSTGGREALASVTSTDEDAVREAADECPGECIFLVDDGVVTDDGAARSPGAEGGAAA
jgi:ferredoxin